MSDHVTIDPIEVGRTALLLMDFQDGIVGRLGDDGPALIDRAVALRATAKAAGVQVAYVRVAFTAEQAAAIPPTNKGFSALAPMAEHMAPDSPATQIAAALAPTDDDIVVVKHRVGAFSTTDLADQLAAKGIDTLVLAGISTSGVVLSTIRDAADRDHRLLVVGDCCADPLAEVHRVLLEQVFPRQADVLDTDAFTTLLARSPATS